MYAGLIFSFPQSAHQPWHQDGEALFEEMDDGRDLPPYALNVFVPLDGVTEELGPTEFWLESHKESTAKEIMKVSLVVTLVVIGTVGKRRHLDKAS